MDEDALDLLLPLVLDQYFDDSVLEDGVRARQVHDGLQNRGVGVFATHVDQVGQVLQIKIAE